MLEVSSQTPMPHFSSDPASRLNAANETANADTSASDPFAGTWLEQHTPEMRRKILAALEADRNPQEDADIVGASTENKTEPTHFPYGIHTYPDHMQREIRASLHLDTVDELDEDGERGVGYLPAVSPTELAARAAEYESTVRANMQRLGRRRDIQVA